MRFDGGGGRRPKKLWIEGSRNSSHAHEECETIQVQVSTYVITIQVIGLFQTVTFQVLSLELSLTPSSSDTFNVLVVLMPHSRSLVDARRISVTCNSYVDTLRMRRMSSNFD